MGGDGFAARPNSAPPHSGGSAEEGEDSGAEAEFLGGGSRAKPPRRPGGAPVEELAEHAAAYEPQRGAAASEAGSSSATASRYSRAGSQGSVGNSRRRARGGLPWAPLQPLQQQQQQDPFQDFDGTEDVPEALSHSSRGPLRPIAYDVHTRPGGIYAHETHSRSFSDPRGSLFWKAQGLWDRRATLLATGERLAKDVWLLVRADPWARRAAIAFACSVGAGTLGVAWLIALVIVQAILLALSSVVGLMLLVSSFLVPIGLLGLSMIGSAAGFFLAGNIGLHVMENREALAARVQELRGPSQQGGGRSSELRVAKDDSASGFPYSPAPDSAASLD
jgi:hypothetical protein